MAAHKVMVLCKEEYLIFRLMLQKSMLFLDWSAEDSWLMKHNQELQWVSWAAASGWLCLRLQHVYRWMMTDIMVCTKRREHLVSSEWTRWQRGLQSCAFEEVIIPRWGIDCTVTQDEVQHASMTTFASQVFHHWSNQGQRGHGGCIKKSLEVNKEHNFQSTCRSDTQCPLRYLQAICAACDGKIILYISKKFHVKSPLALSRNNCSFSWWRLQTSVSSIKQYN